MTQLELLNQSGWYPVVRFSEIEGNSESERNFLEHVRIFTQAKEAGLVLPSGYRLPELQVENTGAYIGSEYIVDLLIVVDRPLNSETNCFYSDGIVIARKAKK